MNSPNDPNKNIYFKRTRALFSPQKPLLWCVSLCLRGCISELVQEAVSWKRIPLNEKNKQICVTEVWSKSNNHKAVQELHNHALSCVKSSLTLYADYCIFCFLAFIWCSHEEKNIYFMRCHFFPTKTIMSACTLYMSMKKYDLWMHGVDFKDMISYKTDKLLTKIILYQIIREYF